jgi:hypothetical protein
MKWLRVHLPSPALIVSTVALVVAMGGTGYAALKLPRNSVGTKQIKKNAVTGLKVKNHSLTSDDINVARLGTVPAATQAVNASNAAHATSADNASHADSADSVGGHTFTTFTKLVATNTTTPQTALDFAGLGLTLACDAAGHPTLNATGSVNHSLIRGMAVTAGAGAKTIGGSDNSPGSPVPLINPADLVGEVVIEYAQPDGHVVSLHAQVDDRTTVGQFDGCSVVGSAIAG